ncbi:hypothetical protein [Kineococcus rubinsiae]|uniref:hypothetical protein n=1 Tax=Kineococcus rubinsiae TaxID=2609562 RepID=UPI001430C4FD|nr:hypothetical protein [Kineococcus rubinsiae]NIZ91385.1 hypothetical protein [Kineococcus rubinsiae]
MNAATQRAAAQTAEALRIEKIAQQVARRYQNVGVPQRAGHLFEVMHELSFNLDAIAKGSKIRAATTEWVAGGSQSAAADLHLSEGGRLLAAAQAKLMSDDMTAARSIVNGRYEGMQRLIPGDQLEAVKRILTKRLSLNPEGLRFTDYADAEAHVTATLHAEDAGLRRGFRVRGGDVSSAPVSTTEARKGAMDATSWGKDRVHQAGVHQVKTAMTAGAVTGAALAGVVEAAKQTARVRAGETSAAAAAATAAGAAAMGAVRAASVAGLGEAISVAVAAKTLPALLGKGSTPAAMAGAVADIAGAGVAFARGEIDASELAERCCETALQTVLVGVCGALAQTAIPVPVVAGLVGGLVGQTAAILISQGLRAALSAAAPGGLPADESVDADLLALLEDETACAIATAMLLGETERALGDARDAYVSATVGPLLDEALNAITSASPEEALKRLGEATRCFDGQPLFVTVDEFDAWMADPTTSLTMNPNWL